MHPPREHSARVHLALVHPAARDRPTRKRSARNHLAAGRLAPGAPRLVRSFAGLCGACPAGGRERRSLRRSPAPFYAPGTASHRAHHSNE
ncbi:hypothetical protein GCM10017786_57640 [Amycolatopsis deserti]|uniref:Uncharacterized protein n=1 Tax=Amycolatopsis deserti TaxID=185696 RepID=A0ABQ3JAM3_9PSEU|nr:hypothetical protein GCM10017786_57640 [Amycolatopsis deserti]